MTHVDRTIRAAGVTERPGRADHDLVRRALGGDDEAFRVIFLRHRDDVYRVACRLFRDSASVDDAVQETFVRFHEAMAGYDATHGRLGAYLGAIARHVCLDRVKALKRRQARRTTPRQFFAGRAGASCDPELVDAARRAVEECCDRRGREVFDLHLEGLPYGEIGARLGMKAHTVSSYVSAIRRRILERLRTFAVASRESCSRG